MLAMAMALTRKPKIILFDEPTATLAPKIAQSSFN
jgi:ABC-type branched-subunit amino acid transport system ATPase component